MLVEDDAPIGAMIADILRHEGCEVVVLAHGRDALEVLRSGSFDAALLDVMLPDIDGISIMRAIRNDPVTKSIPVVMLTARTDDETTWEGWKAGCDYYMTKPFDPEELTAVMRRLHAGTVESDPSNVGLLDG